MKNVYEFFKIIRYCINERYSYGKVSNSGNNSNNNNKNKNSIFKYKFFLKKLDKFIIFLLDVF